jgi:membrane fusion protein, heavy metal efflux system
MAQTRATPPVRWGLLGLIVLIALAGGAAASTFLLPRVSEWLKRAPGKTPDRSEKPASHELVRVQGKPVYPPALRLSEEAALALGIDPKDGKTVVAAEKATRPLPLPPLEGTLAYENDNLFPVRPRFAGEVAEIQLVDKSPQELRLEEELLLKKRLKRPGSSSSGETEKLPRIEPKRPLAFGDWVRGPYRDARGRLRPGQLLAVVWSKDLGDKKAALIDALIDLRRDRQKLESLKKIWGGGAVPRASVEEAKRTVQKDLNLVNAAERILRMWKLSDGEIEELKQEAATIEEKKRDPKKETRWARVEVRAPHDGVIVEKNFNLDDWVDPVNGNPMFRVADLDTLAVWVHPYEEYLPVFQRLIDANEAQRKRAQRKQAASEDGDDEKGGAGQKGGRDDDARGDNSLPELRWKIRLASEPSAEPLEGPVLRVAPSLDPNNRTLLVMGRVLNTDRRLLVGQYVTATIEVKPKEGLVEIPTAALNEEGGQSLVFVQSPQNPLDFSVRRVQVAQRFKDRVFVRSAPDPRFRAQPPAAPGRLAGPWPVQGLRPGERVVTQGVPMLTVALRDLLAREETGPER